MPDSRAEGGGHLKTKIKDRTRMRNRSKEHEEVEYESRSVRELLTEMKDISEIIVDLAYSALILDAKEIGEEVRELETRMDKLNYQIRLTALVASRSMRDAESLTGILQVASAAEKISNAAGDIVDLLDENIDTRPFLPFVLQDADEKFNVIRVDPESELAGRTIVDSRIGTRTGATVIAVNRRSGWIFDLHKSFRVRGNDLLIVRGTQHGHEKLLRFAKGKSPRERGTKSEVRR